MDKYATNKLMNKLFSVLLAAIFCACQPKTELSNEVTTSIADSLSAELWTLHEKGFINGLGVSIVNQDGTLYSNGIGYANTHTNKEYTENTIQNIGSVSKTFIGVALLKAQELRSVRVG